MESEIIVDEKRLNWRAVDRALRSIASRRAALDAEEARWLRDAEALQIWKPLGMVSALDYMERVLGYAPKSGQERLRVARALGDLPEIEAALGAGELAFSGVRELTRVATRRTEDAWLEAARGKNLRQIEELVAGHQLGDRPEDPADPDLRMRTVFLEVRPETYAALRQARLALEEEHGARMEDDAFVGALVARALESGDGERAGRAKFQIAVTVCARCRQGWQDGAGATIPISEAAVERAECDAQHVGSIDDTVPARAHQDVAPAVARLVYRRDHGRCRVSGCRSARGLELHHIVHRSAGGDHEAGNLVLLCSACHQAHHDGKLAISGTAEQLEVRRLTETHAHVGEKHGSVRAQANAALVQLGWTREIAVPAVDAAVAKLGDEAPLERLVFEALSACARPASVQTERSG